MRALRLPNNPIIRPRMDARMGSNINGPSLVRVPDWAPHRLGRHYLYFADHNGTYIRLAYADTVAGPWSMHEPGTLHLAESHFPTRVERPPDRPQPLLVESTPHIASPDVHVDEAGRQFRMYYHGLLPDFRQATRVALSPDGIHFTAREEMLDGAYWRVFRYGGWHFALVMPGVLLRSRDGLTGFERGPALFSRAMRHAAVRVEGETLHVFYTNAGDCPERILYATVDLRGDWLGWRESAPVVVLEPETDYEGVDLPLEPSVRGAINHRARQLRDPALYRDDTGDYLLYCVAGESGIAVARLLPD
jgi:hypothetical protein